MDNDPTPKTFHIKRLQIGVNVLLQIVLVAALVVMVNVLAFNHYKRWDFTRSQKYQLADKTRAVLKNLQKPVKAFVFFPAPTGADIFGDVDTLLKEYQHASKRKFEVETVDVFRDLAHAKDVANKYKLAPENVVVLVYGDRTKVVSANDMADYDFSGAMMGQPPRLRAFKGEQAITGGLVELTQEAQQKVYVLQGHGEFDLSSEELKVISDFISHENIQLGALNLMNVERVPDDAKALLVLGSKYDFTERELKMLGGYWEKKGRLFLALDPAAKLQHLSEWLRDQGITRDADRVMSVGKLVVEGKMLENFSRAILDVPAQFSTSNPVTKKLEGVTAAFLGGTQSLTINPEVASAHGLRLMPAAEVTDKRYWGEADLADLEHAAFNPNRDRATPLTIAVTAEKGATADPRIKVDSGRMVVVGNSVFLTSAALQQADVNIDFVINSLNWLLAREELMGIAPKVKQQFALNLSDDQMRKIALLTWGGFFGNVPGVGAALNAMPVVKFLGFVPLPGLIPFSAALVGIFVWLRRRR